MALGLRFLPLLLTLVNQDGAPAPPAPPAPDTPAPDTPAQDTPALATPAPSNPDNFGPQEDLPNLGYFFNSTGKATSTEKKQKQVLDDFGFGDFINLPASTALGASAALGLSAQVARSANSSGYNQAQQALKHAQKAIHDAQSLFEIVKKANPADDKFDALKKAADEAAQKAAKKAADEAAKKAANEAQDAFIKAKQLRDNFTGATSRLSAAHDALEQASKVSDNITRPKAWSSLVSALSKSPNKSKNRILLGTGIIAGAVLGGIGHYVFGDDPSDNKLHCKYNPGDKTLDFTVSRQNGDLFQASNFRFKVVNNQLVLSQNTEPITERTLDDAISGSRNTVQVFTGGTSGSTSGGTSGSTGTPPASGTGSTSGSTGTPPTSDANNTPGTNNGNNETPPVPNSAHTLLTLAEIANDEQKVEIKQFLSANFPDPINIPQELKRLYDALNPSTPGATAAPSTATAPTVPATSGAAATAAPASNPAAGAAGAAATPGAPATSGSDTASATATPGAPAAPAAVNNIESVLDKIDKLTGNTDEEKLLKRLSRTLAYKSKEIDGLGIDQKKKKVLELALNLAKSLTEFPEGSIAQDDLVNIINTLFVNQ